MPTFYDVLGVPMNASQDEIGRAYRRLIVRFHPDRCYHDNDSVAYNMTRELDNAQMNLLNEAYTVLSNSKKRSTYDDYVTGQLRRDASAYHQHFRQVPPPQRTVQPQLLAFGGGANRSVGGVLGVVKARMAGAASASGQPNFTEEGARGDAEHPQCANPMTRALGTSCGVAEEAAAPVSKGGIASATSSSSSTSSSVSIVYKDSMCVRAINAGPQTVGLVVVTDGGGAAAGTPASTATPESPQKQRQQEPSAAAAAAAISSAASDDHLPRRIRVIEEHFFIRV
ncbi:hypothetical protein, unknown function [Leishmania tarentolae]|uniref:J domain-containing protein n=1 Tax=Leishmania tarentolae TaxID=5689 RepID=A0A640KAR8_LEITA|nr:hypothetical protein, unknown function [Leishmania tarentolae]